MRPEYAHLREQSNGHATGVMTVGYEQVRVAKVPIPAGALIDSTDNLVGPGGGWRGWVLRAVLWGLRKTRRSPAN